MSRKYVHGNRNCGYATIDTSGQTPVFNTPVMLPGMVSGSVEIDQDSEEIYADNKVWVSAKGAKVRTLEIGFRYLDPTYMGLLGFKHAGNDIWTDTGTFVPHALFFEETVEDGETGDVTHRLHIFYNCTGSEPELETETDEDGIEAREIKVSYSCLESTFVKDTDNEYCQYAWIERTNANATLYDTFQSAILLPAAQ